jgi:DNA polymerase-1
MPLPLPADSSTLFLIDGHSLTFKAYYAIRNLTDAQGRPTGAVFGFLRMLLKFADDYAPARLAVVFDTGKPTFRQELYAAYKAHREAPPEDFGVQMGWIHELLAAMGVAVHSLPGFEADDLIATMAEQAKQRGGRAVIVSADKDLMQLVDARVTMLRPAKDEMTPLDPEAVLATLGVRPEQVADWLALVGDSSDNIPGVPGIGAKTATSLLAEYGTLEGLLAAAPRLSRPRQREALLTHVEQARLARTLATVRRDVPLEWDWEACRWPANPWTEATVALLLRLGFESILKERKIDAPARVVPASVHDGGPEAHYEAVTDEAMLRAWVDRARGARWLALDTETTGTDVMRARLVGISLSHQAGEAIYIPLGHRPDAAGCEQIPLEAARAILAPLLDGSGPPLTAHHAKFDWKILRLAGFAPAAPAFDSMIASYLLDPDKATGHGLKALGRELCGVTMAPITELIGSGQHAITMAEVAVAEAADYASRDADVTLRLTQCLNAELDKHPELRRIMDEIEMPLIPVLMEMELGGFRVDAQCLQGLSVELRSRLNALSRQIWEAAGHPFNIGSPKQVAEVLYVELGLPSGKKGKTGFSTDEEELERLAPLHPIPRLILEYRMHEKLQSTYVDALPRLVSQKTGRIHTSFNQTIAATGRLSSTEPNLQNIPIRTEMGRAIRRAFVPDNGDHVLLKADYSQIELRILAHVTGDEALRTAYREGRDIHRQTAGEVFGVAPHEVTPAMRSQAKVINFGIVYGMSAHGLARQLGIGRPQAADFIDRYFNTYPGVRAWIERLLEQARREGWVRTPLGRRRLTPGLNEKNGMIRANAERIAVNSPIQGACADMIKVAMIRIHAELARIAPGARMICQVHDELVFSVPREQVETLGEFVRRTMIQAMPLDVPIEVDLGHGGNWADCTA